MRNLLKIKQNNKITKKNQKNNKKSHVLWDFLVYYFYEGGYEYEIVAGVTNITETDLSKYDEGDEAVIYKIIMKVEIKNDYITKVDFKGVQTTVPVIHLLKTNNNQTIVLDQKGLPAVDTYSSADVVTVIMDVDYKY